MSTTPLRFLLTNGVVSDPSNTPPVTTFLETHPGAYTTSRTHSNASLVLFWERHLKRLAESVRILYNANPQLLFGPNKTVVPLPSLAVDSVLLRSRIGGLVNESMNKVLPVAVEGRREEEELSITTLVSGNLGELGESRELELGRNGAALDVSIHIGIYVPPVFGVRGKGAQLAVVGRGRDAAAAKYSDWVRIRKPLERFRPPSGTELLLSNDGNRILEGTVSNFFVVCQKDNNESKEKTIHCFEVQTASISDGVLPGVIRQLVIEVCLSKGIPFREVAPLWSEREIWEEAFITSSLRIMQHVENVRAPSSWESLHGNSWKDISWKEKQFEEGPGMITTIIQKEIMKKAVSEGYSLSLFG
ncbi:uncharacterized protein LOC126802589 [Argentina anserina]|uniref:uncharacterized protein LOC126802589 n=1 Tax=Argentina anserina TaxID=57926 RepID=UPI0021764137|nr:uncharacterized protein LOC126802589 [Potentilla anserina]